MNYSSFETIELVDVGAAEMAVDYDNHGETDRGLRSGDGDGEDRDHHAGRLRRLRSKSPKRDEIDVRRGQHHLDPDQNENRVTTAQRSEKPDAKQCGRDDEQDRQRHQLFSSITRMSAPIR